MCYKGGDSAKGLERQFGLGVGFFVRGSEFGIPIYFKLQQLYESLSNNPRRLILEGKTDRGGYGIVSSGD